MLKRYTYWYGCSVNIADRIKWTKLSNGYETGDRLVRVCVSVLWGRTFINPVHSALSSWRGLRKRKGERGEPVLGCYIEAPRPLGICTAKVKKFDSVTSKVNNPPGTGFDWLDCFCLTGAGTLFITIDPSRTRHPLVYQYVCISVISNIVAISPNMEWA